MSGTIILPGDTYGIFSIIEELSYGETNRDKRIFKCYCKCGKEAIVTLRQIKRNAYCDSCNPRTKNKTAVKMWRTSEYESYRNMKTRCFNPKHRSYKWYGAKGIKICDRWLENNGHGFKNFLNDMGYKPTPKHQIDRIDSDNDYKPDNCKWSTHQEQQENKKK